MDPLLIDIPEEIAPGEGGKFVRFHDPDGNGWAVQEIRARG